MSQPLQPSLAEVASGADSPVADSAASPALTEPVQGPAPPDLAKGRANREPAHPEPVEGRAGGQPAKHAEPVEGAVSPSQSSPRKLAANRANARKSTGPRTPEGKERSSQNAVKHGLLSGSVERLIAAAMPEERQSYFEVIKQLFEDLLPVGAREYLLVERLAMLALRLLRVHRVESAAMAQRLESAARTGSPLTGVPHDLETILRYDTQAERSFQRTLRELRRLQRDRLLRAAAVDRQITDLLTDR